MLLMEEGRSSECNKLCAFKFAMFIHLSTLTHIWNAFTRGSISMPNTVCEIPKHWTLVLSGFYFYVVDLNVASRIFDFEFSLTPDY